MGARQSKRSVDITTTPKKEGIPAEGGVVVGDAAAPGDGKLERIEETDAKPTTNGIAPHTEVAEDKDKDKDDTEKEKDKEKQQEEVKAEETKPESVGDSPTEAAEVTTPTEATPTSPNSATSPDSKETKKKEKPKKKWSFRSISFSRKDKNKPAREEAPKNGDVTKEEPLAEGGEEVENGSVTAGSPVEEKSAASSPTAENEAAPAAATGAAATAAAAPAAPATTAEAKEEVVAPSAAISPADEKKEESTPSAPTPVPVEEKKEEVEKVDAEKKVVEVSRAGGQSIADPVEVSVFRVQPVATPSIIERKTSEDIPSLPPSSPPPTPIDPSPLQQAQQAQHAVATVTALAEALKLPAEAADKEPSTAPTLSSTSSTSSPPSSSSYQQRNDPPNTPAESLDVSSRPPSSSTDEPQAEAIILVPAKVEALPVVDNDNDNDNKDTDNNRCSIATKENLESKTTAALNEKTNDNEEVESLPVTDANVLVVAPVEERRSSSLSESVEEKCEVKASSSPVVESEVITSSVDKEESTNEILPVVDNEIKVTESSEIKVVERVEVLSDIVAPENVESIEKPMETEVSVDTSGNVLLDTSETPEVETKKVVVETEPVEVVAIQAVELPETEVVTEATEELIEHVIEPIEVPKEETDSSKPIKEDLVVEVKESAEYDLVLNSEEGPVPISQETLVEAKPAFVIPEDEIVERIVEPDVSNEESDSVEVIPDTGKKDTVENETETETPLLEEEIVILDTEKPSVPDDVTIETSQPISETIVVPEKVVEGKTDTIEVVESIPSSMPESPKNVPEEKSHPKIVTVEPNLVASPTIDVVTSLPDVEEVDKVTDCPPVEIEETQVPNESRPVDASVLPQSSSSQVPDDSTSCQSETVKCSPVNDTETEELSSRLENISILSDVPPTREDTSETVVSSEYPLPPEEHSCPSSIPSNVSEIKTELPVPDENAPSLRHPTETLLTPPRSPSPQSNVSLASALTTSTKDCSQTQLYDDQSSNREFKMESVSISLNSYDESDIELKERLAESLTKTENQDESVSCQLSNNNTTSTTVQETHQSTPETEAPVENNVDHEVSTTESLDDAPKVAPPAVPTEVPASPPSAPAITEDVASVAKAIEEIDISDKAVAAATIECNTNEIIADAHYHNNINE